MNGGDDNQRKMNKVTRKTNTLIIDGEGEYK